MSAEGAPAERASDAASAAKDAACAAVFVCDLASGLTDDDLRRVFQHYGEIVTLEQFTDFSEAAAFVEYAAPESAEEAQSMLNHALLRHKTCRCLFANSVDVIRQTMDSGQRLVVENLDRSVQSQGLQDLFGLFGQILDCKVELDEEDNSRGFGFAHFAVDAEAAKARSFMDGMQIGDTLVEVRPFETKDAALFTGVFYASSSGSASARLADPVAVDLAKDLDDAATGDVQQVFQSLQTHHLEVIETIEGKLERLKVLTELYNPNQEQQMIIIANSSNLPAIGKVLGEVFEEGDFETVSFATSKDDRKDAIEGFDTGNLFALILGSDVATRADFELKKKSAVLVNFDMPSTHQTYLDRVFKRADGNTRAHGFFLPGVDNKLAMPLMAVMEEAGHEIPPGLVELLG